MLPETDLQLSRLDSILYRGAFCYAIMQLSASTFSRLVVHAKSEAGVGEVFGPYLVEIESRIQRTEDFYEETSCRGNNPPYTDYLFKIFPNCGPT